MNILREWLRVPRAFFPNRVAQSLHGRSTRPIAYTAGVDVGFARALFESFKSAWSAVIGVVALALSVALWLLVPDTRVSLAWIVPVATLILVVLLVAVFTLIDALLKSRDLTKTVEGERDKTREEFAEYKARGGLPDVVSGREPFEGMRGELLCLLNPSDLFSPEILVSFFRVDEQEVEEPIGIGVVFNVQGNGIIQVTMTEAFEGHQDFVDRLRRNEGEAVRNTLVKPNVARIHAGL